MRKATAMILAILMVLTLFACKSQADNTTPSASAPATASAPPASEAPASEDPAAPDASGKFVIPPVDFKAPTDPFSRETYKIANLNIFQTPFGAYMDECYVKLGAKLNYEYSNLSSNGDIDNFMVNIETCAGQDFDGMIIQGDFTTQDRIFELVEEYDIKYIPGLSPFVDEANNYVTSSVVMDSYDLGASALQFMVDNFEKYTKSGIDIKDIGFITVTFSTVTDLNARVDGALAKYKELYPDLAATNYFPTDTVGAGVNAITAQAAYDLISATVSGNPEMKGWIVFGSVEDFSAGAARALEELGKQGSAIVTSCAATTLMSQWAQGYEGVWVAGVDTPPVQWADATINGLLAIIDGTATHETLWETMREPGQTYTVIKLPYTIVEKDMYESYEAACNAYIDEQYPG